jgi:hypothetical protein
MMTTDPRDQQSEQVFEQDLESVRSAWSMSEQVQPPELLNQAVLNTARRELDARRKRRPLRWLGAFATATVVVLAMTIVVQQNGRENLEENALPERASGQLLQESRERTEFGAKQSARSAAKPARDAPLSKAAAVTVMEEMASAPAEMEMQADPIPEAEAWIKRLQLLLDTQQDEKLVQELAAFRLAYPDYPLPAGLQ